MSSHGHRKPPSTLPFPFNNIANAIHRLDAIWFRGFTIATCACGIIFKVVHPQETPLWMVVVWNIIFILINAVHIGIIIIERRGVQFNDDEKELFDTIFSQLTPVEFMKLLRIGDWQCAMRGATLTTQGEPLHELILIYDGSARVLVNEQEVAMLRDGAFIGEMSLLQEGPASATVVAAEPTRYLIWPKSALKELLERNPALDQVIHSIVATDLTRKLLRR